MLDHGIQAHEETDPPGSTDPADIVNTTASRLQTSGYPIFSGGESVFAFSKSVEYGHAGFEVDWGFGPGGVQIGVGHRVNNHEPAFREIGIGVLHGARTVVVNGATNTVGPQLVTFEFGTRFDNPALVTGVAYYDLNANQLYDVGEGIGGLTVEVSDSASFAVTAGSGGYAVPTANGSRSVTFSGPGLTVAPKAINVAGGANLKLDLRLAYAPPVLTGPAAAFLGGPNAYSFAPVPGATSYVWESARRLPFTSVLGAETGLGDLTVAVTPGYPVITAESRRSGAASYHLVTPTQDLQSLTLNARLRASADSKLVFATRLAAATTNQMARAQVSTDFGANWATVWEQPGRAVNNSLTIENGFTLRTVSLAAFAGQELAVRFTYGVAQIDLVTFFTQTESFFGFFLDDVSFTGVEQLTDLTTVAVDGPAFAFTPAAAGNYALRARPQIGARTFTPGPWLLVGTTNVAPPVVVIGPSGIVLGPNGNLRVDFKVTAGTPSSFALERADTPQGPWLSLSATLATNSPGNFSYKQIAPTGTAGFLRVRVH